MKWNFILVLKLFQAPRGYSEKDLWNYSVINDDVKAVYTVVQALVRWDHVLALSSQVILNRLFSFSESQVSQLQNGYNTLLKELLQELRAQNFLGNST